MFGQAIKTYREKHRLTQAQLAEKVFVTPQAIDHYEHGRRQIPVEVLKLLSEVLNFSILIMEGDAILMEKEMIYSLQEVKEVKALLADYLSGLTEISLTGFAKGVRDYLREEKGLHIQSFVWNYMEPLTFPEDGSSLIPTMEQFLNNPTNYHFNHVQICLGNKHIPLSFMFDFAQFEPVQKGLQKALKLVVQQLKPEETLTFEQLWEKVWETFYAEWDCQTPFSFENETYGDANDDILIKNIRLL